MDRVVIEQAPGIFQVAVPVPLPLKSVNCYLLRGATRWAIVDAGMPYAPAEATWQAALDELGLTWGQIGTILVTHYHPDHYGLAGWLQERSGAPVLMAPIEAATVARVWERDVHCQADENRQFFAAHGMPRQLSDAMFAQIRDVASTITLRPAVTVFDPAAPLTLGERTWQVLTLPGHTDGQTGLYAPEERLALLADHLLERITPNISLWPESRPDPLQAYLGSLDWVATLAIERALVGHGPVIGDVRGRIAAISAHHAERLDAMEQLAGAGRSGWEICQASFPVAALSIHQIRFAMAETLAHLAYLEAAGRLERPANGLYVATNSR